MGLFFFLVCIHVDNFTCWFIIVFVDFAHDYLIFVSPEWISEHCYRVEVHVGI